MGAGMRSALSLAGKGAPAKACGSIGSESPAGVPGQEAWLGSPHSIWYGLRAESLDCQLDE